MQRETKKRNAEKHKAFRALCWRNDFAGAADLARAIGRSRETVWRALRWPDQYSPTIKLIQERIGPIET